jgi:hypothetical protein
LNWFLIYENHFEDVQYKILVEIPLKLAEIKNWFAPSHLSVKDRDRCHTLDVANHTTQTKHEEIVLKVLTKLMSVKRTIPYSVFPNLPPFSDEDREVVGVGINQPSILAKSRRPKWRNKRDTPSLMQSITSVGKRGGV